ncbi:polyribonucleotide nucleotidyltransferase, partial [Candidatus Liberibacter asiaticus]
AKMCAKEPIVIDSKDFSKLEEEMSQMIKEDLRVSCFIPEKYVRCKQIDDLKKKMVSYVSSEHSSWNEGEIVSVFEDIQAKVVRTVMLDKKVRMDGRDSETVRDISAQVGLLQRTHGSSLFIRGDTQAIVVVT